MRHNATLIFIPLDKNYFKWFHLCPYLLISRSLSDSWSMKANRFEQWLGFPAWFSHPENSNPRAKAMTLGNSIHHLTLFHFFSASYKINSRDYPVLFWIQSQQIRHKKRRPKAPKFYRNKLREVSNNMSKPDSYPIGLPIGFNAVYCRIHCVWFGVLTDWRYMGRPMLREPIKPAWIASFFQEPLFPPNDFE